MGSESTTVIEIRHRTTGGVLHRLEANTLAGADLTGINLCNADLVGMDLRGAILTGSVCRFTQWRGANLSRADLRGAYLADADFRGANLSGALLFSDSLDTADLTGANLTGANLTGAYCAEARFVGANLSYANLQSAYLGDADLTGARLAFSLFADCPSLVQAVGLREVEHFGPSMLDLTTLRAGLAELPDSFLRGVGLARDEIQTLRTLYGQAGCYASCFLAFDAADSDLAARLRSDLQANNVSCWPFCPDLGAGYPLQIVFNHAVRRRSRLILLCSETAVRQGRILEAAQNVTGHKPETDRPQPLLLLLDDFVSSNLAVEAPLSDWRHYFHHCPSIDFGQWQHDDRYKAALRNLLDAITR
jgi:uncharacterized protein YjbI with pentapeptide repeats